MHISKQRQALLLLIPFLSLLLSLDAAAQDDCTPIRFEPSTTSAVITGQAPAEDILCYSLTTLSGQTATLELLEGSNVMFGIRGLVEAQDHYSFTTERKTYLIVVSQLMRSVTDQPFRLSLSVRD